MKQPVVLQVLPRLRAGGVERGTIEIAGALKRAGWRALVASEGGGMLSGLAHAGGEHITLPLASKNPLTLWRNARRLEEIIQSHQVDIIHARSRAPAWSAYLAARNTRTPFVTTFHGVYGLHPALKKYYNAIMTKGDRVIAISRFVAQHIAEHYSPDPSRVRIIPRGVDLSIFDPLRIVPSRMADLIAKWRMPEDVPIILLPGRITRWKGQSVLVEALARLPHRHFFCLLLGDDGGHSGYRQELEARILSLGLGAHIRLVGHTSAMAEAYMLADVVISPSTEPEAFGRVPVEAQAMGRLVIATRHGGACETIIEECTGWLVNPDDADDLSRAIERALGLSREDKERMGSQAMEHVRTCFSSEFMCQKTLETYWELIKEKYE